MSEPVSRRTKVLIVEDNEAVVATLQILLNRANYDVIAATTGEGGIEKARAEQPDVILLDWILPDGEGPDLLGTIRDFCGAPCIMITAQDTAQHCVEALEAGCDDFIAKPIRPDELLLRLARLLKKRSALDEC